MNTGTAYTPLESLLLFQSLAVFGTDPNVFARISDLLKNNILVRDGDRYDPGRLSPDALRELYLQLLREELRSELEAEIPGDASPSKKRKIQLPPLPTIKDAKKYSGKLPQLVDRLYARYRDHMIQSIRDDERKYEVLKREIKEIERGEWDDRILKDERYGQRTASEDSRKAPSVSRGSEKPERPVSRDAELHAVPATSPQPSLLAEPRHEGLAINDVVNSHEAPASPRTSEKDLASRVRNGNQTIPSINHHGTPSNDRPHGHSPQQPSQRPPPPDRKWENYQPPPTQPYSPQAPAPQGYLPYPQGQFPTYPQRGSFSGPLPPVRGQVPSSPLSTHAAALTTPNIQGSSSPAQHLDQLADVAEQQFRAPQSPMAAPQQGLGPQINQYPPASNPQMGLYPPNSGLRVSQYSPNQYPHPPPQQPFRGNGQPQPGQQPTQWNQYQQFAPPPANYYPAPTPPQPGQRPFPVRPDISQPEQRQYNSPYNPSGGQAPSLKSTPAPKYLLRDSQPSTPASRQVLSTGKATRWTPVATPGTPKATISPNAPEFEPLSPLPKPAILPKEKAKKPRGRPPRIRAGSTASPAPRITETSHAADPKVKKETSGLRSLQDLALPTSAEDTRRTTTDEGPLPTSSPLRKRKRSPTLVPSRPPTHVVWTRNFPRISASALERIGAHRCASTFANPIKERDAPGYKNVILRPQDLKSIRSAITAGTRAGLAAVASMGEEMDKGQANLQLPVSEELVPPKGIVNNSQLEKELMLMFANAIMFNPDPNRGFGRAFPVGQGKRERAEENGGYALDEDGVVRDTKVMFADVEKIVGELRSAEQRKSEEKESAERRARESESVDDGDQDGPGKKRKRI